MILPPFKLFIPLILLLGSLGSAEVNICLSDFWEVLPEESIEQINTMRTKASKHCLECGTTACRLKEWDQANQTNKKVCNRLFCKPIKRTQKKSLFSSNENHGFGQTFVSFTYSVNQKGRVVDVDLKSLEGEMDKKRAKIFLKDNLKTLRYEPIEIDGKKYSLVDLNGQTGWNIIEQ